MASSKAAIFNMALTLLGQEPISDPDSSDDARAIVLRQTYDICRQALLEEHLWNFALERTVLALDSTSPEFEYTNRFELPANCIRVVKMYDTPEQYKEEGNFVLSDTDSLNLIYVKNITDVTYFPALFTKVLAYDLAISCEYKITNNQNLQNSLIAQRQQALIKAKMVDAQKDQTNKSIKSGTSQARYKPYGTDE